MHAVTVMSQPVGQWAVPGSRVFRSTLLLHSIDTHSNTLHSIALNRESKHAVQ